MHEEMRDKYVNASTVRTQNSTANSSTSLSIKRA